MFRRTAQPNVIRTSFPIKAALVVSFPSDGLIRGFKQDTSALSLSLLALHNWAALHFVCLSFPLRR